MSDKTAKSNPKGRPQGSASFAWRAFFQQSKTPIFVLGKGRRLRYANPAWEQIAGANLSEVLGLVCSIRRHSSLLAAAMAPTPEVLAGKADKSRRAAPQHRTGPPWWDVTFVPLAGDGGPLGIVGFVEVVGQSTAAAARKVSPRVMALRDRQAGRFTLDLFAGTDRLAGQLRLASQIATAAWILGEPGSGKETAARVIHYNGSRREKTFLALDCAGLQPFLIESLIWGHGGLAGGDRLGTIYLKEPSALPRDVQGRFLELVSHDEGQGPRLICGSVRPALDDVKEGRLVPEFHSQCSLLELRVPPLRERREDLPRIIALLLARLGGKTIEPPAVALLKEHPWPGNIRELATVLAGAGSAAEGGAIKREHFPRELGERLGVMKPVPERSLALDTALEAVEKRLIQRAMAKAEGNATKAAELLGIWRPRLLRRIEALGLDPSSSG